MPIKPTLCALSLSCVLLTFGMPAIAGKSPVAEPIAYHPPCSLQHGLKQKGIVEGVLREAGFTLTGRGYEWRAAANPAELLQFDGIFLREGA